MSEILRGLGVSPGVAVGRVLWLDRGPVPDVPEPVSVERIPVETERFERARTGAREQIVDLRARAGRLFGERYAALLEAQVLILDDPSLMADVVDRIRREAVSASWALRETVRALLARFAALEDPLFQERGGDLEDVHRRLQRLLRARREPNVGELEGPVVVVAHDLGPSEAISLARGGIAAIAIDVGGPTSHTAILAQALGVPAVIALGHVTTHARYGDDVVVDGDEGTVELRPESAARARGEARRAAWLAHESALVETPRGAPRTRDGVEIVLRANVEFPAETRGALRQGAGGIGLYRSEFLFLEHAPTLPSEEDHYLAYREIVESAAPHPAVIRTLDLGGEKYFQEVLSRSETNPVLGLRAIRLCLQRPDIFRPQLRGLLRAACHGDLRVLVPLVTSAEEVRQLRRALADEAAALRAEGVPHRADVPVGLMIETPAAAAVADLLAPDADFFSIGTNDLIQYALAVDRGNPAVAYLFDPCHPAVLRAIHFVVRAARACGIPVSLCGEMASDPALTGCLVGLGLRELSVRPRAVAAVRQAVATVDSRSEEARAAEVLTLPTAIEIRARLGLAGERGR